MKALEKGVQNTTPNNSNQIIKNFEKRRKGQDI